ncbi:hypothetical protein EJB05_51800, partial [Eragrostis curvula]
MATAPTSMVVVVMMLLTFVAPALSGETIAGQLSYDFYSSSCPRAEEVIQKTTWEIISKDTNMGAALVKFFFLDCFVMGCDASLLLAVDDDNPDTEKSMLHQHGYAYDNVDNVNLYNTVNKIKEAVEAICPGVVSCADILALAARDSAAIAGGFSFAMPTGRRDTPRPFYYYMDYHSDAPHSYLEAFELIDSFAYRGLDIDDLVVLSGAHSFGIAHCGNFDSLLYPSIHPTMNATYAAELKKVCPWPSPFEMGPIVNNNRVTDPNVLSNQYYSNVLTGQVLFWSDHMLMSRNDTAAKVAFYANNPLAWKVRFAAAMVKMGKIQVLTGTQGEVRMVCNATNY